MVTRTDIHRPSAIVPADYQFVAVEYIYDGDGDLGVLMFLEEQRKIIAAHMKRTGGTYSSHEHAGNCHICGAHCVYTALFYHDATNSYIRTGMDCASKMHMGDEKLFRRLKDEVSAAREARAGKLKAKGILAEANLMECWDVYAHGTQHEFDEEKLAEQGWLIKRIVRTTNYSCKHEGTEASNHRDALANCRKCHGHGYYDGEEHDEAVFDWTFEFNTIRDIVHKLVKYGSISDKQKSFLGKLLRDAKTRKEREAKFAAEKANAKECVVGRQTVQVDVLKVTVQDGQYGMTTKMLVKHADGWTAWGTAPAGCLDVRTDKNDPNSVTRSLNRGDRVELTATFKQSDKDTKFGFFSRPIGKVL